MFLTPELSLSPTSRPSLQLPLPVLEDWCCHRENKPAGFIKGERMYQCQKATKGQLTVQRGREGGELLMNVPVPCPEGAGAGGRGGIHSLWSLDSAECHTSVGFGCQQMGSGRASPLPLPSAGAPICSMEGEDMSHSALSLLLLSLVCFDTCALSASTQRAATICSMEGRCVGEDFWTKATIFPCCHSFTAIV